MLNVRLEKEDREIFERRGYCIIEDSSRNYLAITEELTGKAVLDIVNMLDLLIVLTEDQAYYCEGTVDITTIETTKPIVEGMEHPVKYLGAYLEDNGVPVYCLVQGKMELANYEGGVLEIILPE